jgi:hypothetical protein
LKKLLAEADPDKAMLREITAKNGDRDSRPEAVEHCCSAFW